MSYLLSIVVPTKNRYKYLKHLINMIEGFGSDEIELVIQDNSDENTEIESFVNDHQISCLKYYYNGEKLTSIQNFDIAIKHAAGDYVCFIGDDDGVTRHIVECARWMNNNNIEAARSAKTYYNWPEVIPDGLVTYETSGKVVEYLNPLLELKHVLNDGCQYLENIPVTYTGIVKREILESIYADYGTYFPGGASADIANGVALCFYVKRYAKINIPIIITGTSKHTGGVINRNKPLPFAEVPFISQSVEANWEGDLPQYWLGPLVWPESAIKSLRTMGKEPFILELNYNKMFARTIMRFKFSKDELRPYIKSETIVHFYILTYWFHYYYNGIRDKIINLFSRGSKGLNQCRSLGAKTIVEAEKTLIQMYPSLPAEIID